MEHDGVTGYDAPQDDAVPVESRVTHAYPGLIDHDAPIDTGRLVHDLLMRRQRAVILLDNFTCDGVDSGLEEFGPCL